PTVALPEILGNKWYMVDDRSEPRDLFAVWWGLCREGNDFADLARGHLAKYGFRPVRQVLNEARKRLPGRWEERLAHQLRALPEFDQVLRQVAGRYEAWEEAGKPTSDR
ncbi:MAG: nucleotidyl transferase AbiEii/AbiGii toxin family protein, partial [Actinomycetota bacterium]